MSSPPERAMSHWRLFTVAAGALRLRHILPGVSCEVLRHRPPQRQARSREGSLDTPQQAGLQRQATGRTTWGSLQDGREGALLRDMGACAVISTNTINRLRLRQDIRHATKYETTPLRRPNSKAEDRRATQGSTEDCAAGVAGAGQDALTDSVGSQA